MNDDLKWYEFRQNNTGGSFIQDNEVSIYVLIQSTSVEDANRKANDVGIYFGGVEAGWDCDCCGDRWHEAWDKVEEPFVTYGSYKDNYKNTVHANVREAAQTLANQDIWADKGKPSVIVHFADGTVERFFNEEKNAK